MPIYEYKCETCGYEFEEMLHFSERDVPLNTPCEQQIEQTKHMSFKCGGKVHLKMSLGSFQLKGVGWYKDGYGSQSEKKKEEPKVEKIEKTEEKT
tara:strand:- start:80 stop:364 length:285 start_codon:yes stop_codon:yes gene_type:complete